MDFPVGESNPGLPRSEQTAGRLTGGYTDHYTNREMDGNWRKNNDQVHFNDPNTSRSDLSNFPPVNGTQRLH
jgi:hypothetical protein